jgi:flagellar hook-associated protein 2
MATLTSSGVGSGIDINGLLDQIVAAERAPTENRLNLQEAKIQAKISAYGSMKSAVSTFQSSVSKLTTASGFLTNNVNVSNKDVLTASASSIATAGSYSVEVDALAQAHALASVAFDQLDSVIGTGTLTFDFGTTVYDPGTSFVAADDTYTSFTANTAQPSKSITIDNTNNTVEGVRDAINAAKMGVTASIVNDGSGYRLLLTSKNQGLENGMRVSVDEGGLPAANTDTSGLSQLAFNSDATNMEQTQAAQDAEIMVNGLHINRQSNSIADVIHGVTLNLLSAKPGTTLQVSVSADTATVEKNISSFVTAYNDLTDAYKGFAAYNAETGTGGVLTGDATSRTLMSQLRRQVGVVLQNGSSYNSLSSVGITTNRDGTLSLDSSQLHNAVVDNPASVASLFHTMGTTTDSAVSYLSANSSTVEGNYAVNVSTLASQGSLAGLAVTAPITIDSSNYLFSVVVDGSSSGTLSLTQATYNDMDALAQEIANRINAASGLQNLGKGVTVSYNTDHFEIHSLKYGSTSSVTLGSTLNAFLGLSTGATATTGVDVAGTIGSTLATGEGQVLTGTGDASGLALQITGSATGSRGTVNYSSGVAGGLNALISGFLAKNGQITTKTDSLNAQISDITSQREQLSKRLVALEARYRAQFVAMDTLVATLQSTGNYLTQQLDALPKISVNK